MALNRDKMIEAIAAGRSFPIYKASVANMGAGYICSLWRAGGAYDWAQGEIPGAASTPTDATIGALVLPDFTGVTARIYSFKVFGPTIGGRLLYDRIAHMGGLVGNITTGQTVNLDVETAKTAGRCGSAYRDVEWFVEIYTDLGTSASNLTVTYTDTADTESKTIVISGFTGASPLNRVGRCVQLIPTDNIPIKSVQSVQLSATSGTAGNFGVTARVQKVTVFQPIANIMTPGADAISIGMPEIKSASCLELLVYCSTTSTGILMGDLRYGMVAE